MNTPTSDFLTRISSVNASSDMTTIDARIGLVDVMYDSAADVYTTECRHCDHTQDAYPEDYAWLLGLARFHRCDPTVAELLRTSTRRNGQAAA